MVLWLLAAMIDRLVAVLMAVAVVPECQNATITVDVSALPAMPNLAEATMVNLLPLRHVRARFAFHLASLHLEAMSGETKLPDQPCVLPQSHGNNSRSRTTGLSEYLPHQEQRAYAPSSCARVAGMFAPRTFAVSVTAA